MKEEAKKGVWTETNSKKSVKPSSKGQNLENSIIADIFGGVIRNDFHIDGSRSQSISYDRCYVLTLDIPFSQDPISIEDCLDHNYKENKVEGYKSEQSGKVVKCTQTHMFDKLPNILVINLKRFIYTNQQLIKKKENVSFDDTLVIQDNHVSPDLQLGIFK